MDSKFFCDDCGVYTYYCECLPETRSPYYDDLLHRLHHETDTIMGEDDVRMILRLLPHGEQTKLLLHPVQNGFYSARVITTTPAY